MAKAKSFARFASTFFALVPTSATLIENNGLRAAIATVSAVEVLPTPGGPDGLLSVVVNSKTLWNLTVKEYHQPFPFLGNYVIHHEAAVIVFRVCCPMAIDQGQDHFLGLLSISEFDSVP